MILKELKTRIGTIIGITFAIRLGFAPDDLDEVIVLRETGGTGAELGFGVAGIQYEHPVIHVEVRGAPKDYAAPRAQLELIFQDLPKVQADTLTSGAESGYYLTIIPRQAPFLAYIDEKRRPVLISVFDITKKPST